MRDMTSEARELRVTAWRNPWPRRPAAPGGRLPGRSSRPAQNRCAARRSAYWDITCSSTVLPKPFCAGLVTGWTTLLLPLKGKPVSGRCPFARRVDGPFYADAAARHRQRAILGGVGGQLVQRQGEVLRRLRVQDDGRPGDRHAAGERGASRGARVPAGRCPAIPARAACMCVCASECRRSSTAASASSTGCACRQSCARPRPARPRTGSWCGGAISRVSSVVPGLGLFALGDVARDLSMRRRSCLRHCASARPSGRCRPGSPSLRRRIVS